MPKYSQTGPPFQFQGHFTETQKNDFRTWTDDRVGNLPAVSRFHQMRAQRLRKVSGALEQHYVMQSVQGIVSVLANAIARAEGFGASATNKSTRTNNPGDLDNTDNGHTHMFATAADGFAALERQIQKMLTGQSAAGYNPNMTIAQIGKLYATDPNWPVNVAAILGVPVTTTLAQIASGAVQVKMVTRPGQHLIQPTFQKAAWQPGTDGHWAYGYRDDHVPSVTMSKLKGYFRPEVSKAGDVVFQMNHVRGQIEHHEDKAQYATDAATTVPTLWNKIDALFGKPEYQAVLVRDISDRYKGEPRYRTNPLDEPTQWEKERHNHGATPDSPLLLRG